MCVLVQSAFRERALAANTLGQCHARGATLEVVKASAGRQWRTNHISARLRARSILAMVEVSAVTLAFSIRFNVSTRIRAAATSAFLRQPDGLSSAIHFARNRHFAGLRFRVSGLTGQVGQAGSKARQVFPPPGRFTRPER